MTIEDTHYAVQINNVNPWFGDLHVLKDIDLTVHTGEVVAVIGPSGSGKSTLCRTMNRLEAVEAGTITLDGVPLPAEGKELARLRSSIDNIDAALVHLLAERFKCTQAVGELKAAAGMPAADPGREEAQVARLRALADESGLDPQFAEAFLNFIIAEVIHHHEHLANGS